MQEDKLLFELLQKCAQEARDTLFNRRFHLCHVITTMVSHISNEFKQSNSLFLAVLSAFYDPDCVTGIDTRGTIDKYHHI